MSGVNEWRMGGWGNETNIHPQPQNQPPTKDTRTYIMPVRRPKLPRHAHTGHHLGVQIREQGVGLRGPHRHVQGVLRPVHNLHIIVSIKRPEHGGLERLLQVPVPEQRDGALGFCQAAAPRGGVVEVGVRGDVGAGGGLHVPQNEEALLVVDGVEAVLVCVCVGCGGWMLGSARIWTHRRTHTRAHTPQTTNGLK